MPFGRGAPISALHDQFELKGHIDRRLWPQPFVDDEIHEKLSKSLFLEDDPAIQWSLVVPGGISRRDEAFWSGHANDALPLAGGGVLVASDTGGAWLVRRGVSTPLSNTWAQPNLNCFIVGPTDNHVLAAGRDLSVTNWNDNLPMLSWRAVQMPVGVAEIFGGTYLGPAGVVVIADDIGVHWAHWPNDWSDPWLWNQVPVLQPGRYSGIASGPGDTVAVGYWGINLTNGFYGIVRLRFAGGTLSIEDRAVIVGSVSENQMACVKLTSSAANQMRMYASASSEAGQLLTVLTSKDGGGTWSECGTSLTTSIADQGDLFKAAGDQGNGYNNCIQASPVNPDVVLLGWRNGGVFLSTDGGRSWQLRHGEQDSPHLHSDAHAIRFDAHDPSGQRFVVCTDGGVVSTDNLGDSYDSVHNRGLPDLQFQSMPAHCFDGTFAVSPVIPGIIAGPLQDNGIVWARVNEDETWHSVTDSDGYHCVLLHTGQLLFTTNVIPAPNVCNWQTNRFSGHSPVPVKGPKPGLGPNDAGLYDVIPDSKAHWYRGTKLGQVRKPGRRNGRNQLMYAIGSVYSDVYGMYANTDGGDARWQYVGTVPIDTTKFEIRCLASFNGHNIYVGTSDGRIFALDAAQGASVELNVTTRTGDGKPVTRLLDYDGQESAFAILGNDLLKLSGGFAFQKVAGLPDETLFAVEVEPQRGEPIVFVATDSRVYVSRDGGASWRGASKGLPERVHGSDLRVGPSFSESHILYFSTYGRSVWSASIPST